MRGKVVSIEYRIKELEQIIVDAESGQRMVKDLPDIRRMLELNKDILHLLKYDFDIVFKKRVDLGYKQESSFFLTDEAIAEPFISIMN